MRETFTSVLTAIDSPLLLDILIRSFFFLYTSGPDRFLNIPSSSSLNNPKFSLEIYFRQTKYEKQIVRLSNAVAGNSGQYIYEELTFHFSQYIMLYQLNNSIISLHIYTNIITNIIACKHYYIYLYTIYIYIYIHK